MSDPIQVPTAETRAGESQASVRCEWLTARRFLLVLALALLAAFPKVAVGLQTFFYRDFGALGYPNAIYQRASFLHGELPFWNPYSHCGVPYLAQMGQWYPPSLICLVLPLPWAVNFSMFLHLLWGGLGMYWLSRRWGAGPFAAGFAGFAFAFNGVTLSCLLWGNYIASLAWLPWVVGCVSEAWKHGGRWTALAAIASALQVLTATPELTLLSWVFLGTLWIGALIARETGVWLSLWRLGSVIVLAAGITMVQMLPFFDLLAHSQRDPHYGTAVWAMPGWGWANLLVPLFHCYQAPQGPWFQTGQEFLASYYLGAGVLAMGIVGVCLARKRLSAVVAGMALLCWIMALGSNTIFYNWIRHVFPWIGIARFPVKFAILPAFLVPLLAAWAVERVQTQADRVARRCCLIVAAALLLLMGMLVWFARQYPFSSDDWNATEWNALWRGVLMIVLLAGVLALTRVKAGSARLAVQLAVLAVLPLDALTHSPNIAPTLPASRLAPGLWQASGKPPPPKLGEGRIMISPDAELRLLYSHVPGQDSDFVGKRLAEWYNLNLLDMVPKVTGAMTLRPAHFDTFEQYLYYAPGSSYGKGLLDFLSVAWFSSPENPVQWSPRTSFLPVVTAGQRPEFARDDQILRAITAGDFDPRAVVYLPESARSLVTVSNRTACAVRSVQFNAQHVTVDVESAEPSLVVLSQTFYHLWQAFVDGKPAPLLRANLAFQALQVPAGAHRVTLVYRDGNFVMGAIISLLSITACGLVWVKSNPKRNQETPRADPHRRPFDKP